MADQVNIPLRTPWGKAREPFAAASAAPPAPARMGDGAIPRARVTLTQ
jgi:hypothetical protein